MAVERKHALEREEVRARERQLQLALQTSRMVAWEWDPVRNIVTTTENLRDIYGVPAVKMAEQGFAMVHPDDVERHRATVDRAIATGTSYESEFRIVRPDTGAVVWMQERGAPLLDESGKIQKLVGVVMDITTRKQAEDVLTGQSALLDLTFDAILVREFTTDAVQFWNRGAQELYGFLRDEVIGRESHDVLQTVHPIPVDEVKEILLRQGHWEGELIHTKKDGSRIVVESRWALQTDRGRPVAILEANTDITERKAAEEALRQSEEHYRTIVATANEGVWLVDVEARTVYANDRMAAMLGYTPEELADLTVIDCTFPDDVASHREHIGQNVEGKVEQFDTRFRRKDGSSLLVLGCTSPVRDATGTVVGALGMFTNITERKQAEQERLDLLARAQEARAQAEEAQQRLTVLADASALLASSLDYETTLRSLANAVVPRIADWCAVHLVDADGTVRQIAVTHRDPAKVALAHELERRFPYAPNARVGVAEVLRSGRPELVSEVSDELLEQLTSEADLLQVLRDLGFSSWMVIPLAARGHLLGAITLVAAESGRHYGQGDVALAEVLARRAALAVDNARLYQEAQRVAAEQSAILSQMADGVAMVDPAGRLTFLNEAGQRLTGGESSSSLEAALTRHAITTVDGEPFALDQLPLAQALARRETVSDARWRLTRVDGTDIVVQGSATPVVGESGELLGAVSTFRDVTAQVVLEQQKEDFLSAAAHDLKTPLTSLQGLAQMLQRHLARDRDTNPEQLREGLQRIEQNARRMTSMINELLDLSRLEMGEGLELNRRSVDLVSLVTQSVAEHRDTREAGRLTLDSRVPELVGIWDADRLERVIGNLLSNAVKYGSADAPIVVTVREENQNGTFRAVVSVEDHGIGIPHEDLPHIFERFHRGGNVSRDTLGTGIGLAASKQIVEQHGGTIDVVSQEGIGSTFTVRLPLTSTDDTMH